MVKILKYKKIEEESKSRRSETARPYVSRGLYPPLVQKLRILNTNSDEQKLGPYSGNFKSLRSGLT